MTENTILSRELLSFLGSYPKALKYEGHGFAGQLAVQLGNTCILLSQYFERDQPQVYQPLEENPQSLFALGKQFREVGLKLWDVPKNTQSSTPPDLVERLHRAFDQVNVRIGGLEALILKGRKGGKR